MPTLSMQISHKHLEAFQAIILTGGFTKAARLLRTSQPSISRLVGQLQDAVGFALFARIDGHTVPTAEALALNQEVERSFLGLDKVMQRAANIRDQRIGHLRIISMPALAQTFLPKVLAGFLKTRPGVMASLQVQRSEAIPGWITTQQYDLGFAMLPMEKPGIVAELFDPALGVCVMPRSHALAHKPFIEARDLRDVPFVSSGPNSIVHRAISLVFERAGFQGDIRIETPITAIACQLVAEGAGVTIADPFTASAFGPLGLIARPFRPEVPFDFGILYPAHTARSTLAEQFVEAVQQARDAMYREHYAQAPHSAPPRAAKRQRPPATVAPAAAHRR